MMYEITELRKFTAPIPSGERILAAYGKVITGNIIPEIVFMPLSIMFFFTEAMCRS